MNPDMNQDDKSCEGDDIVILSPPSKKARMPTISWNDKKLVAALERAYMSKPYVQKRN
jgi:hypothetical protein